MLPVLQKVVALLAEAIRDDSGPPGSITMASLVMWLQSSVQVCIGSFPGWSPQCRDRAISQSFLILGRAVTPLHGQALPCFKGKVPCLLL